LFPDIVTGLIRTHRPSIVLFPSSEAGRDLAPRLAQRFSTGLTTHCTELEIIDSDEHGKGLLLMKRPGFSGNMMASMICPYSRPQMATVQPGVFEKKESSGRTTGIIAVEFPRGDSESRISSLEAPLRWDAPRVPLEQSPVIIAGGRGIGSRKNFDHLRELADILEGEVGATRVPVFNGWCGEERMIGQTGKTVRPKLYMGFGVSGQLQHTASIIDSEIIVSVNTDQDAPINEISDYVIHEDAGRFLSGLIAHLKSFMVRNT
jgi:electron transfer flavoprotein alpha subunit